MKAEAPAPHHSRPTRLRPRILRDTYGHTLAPEVINGEETLRKHLTWRTL